MRRQLIHVVAPCRAGRGIGRALGAVRPRRVPPLGGGTILMPCIRPGAARRGHDRRFGVAPTSQELQPRRGAGCVGSRLTAAVQGRRERGAPSAARPGRRGCRAASCRCAQCTQVAVAPCCLCDMFLQCCFLPLAAAMFLRWCCRSFEDVGNTRHSLLNLCRNVRGHECQLCSSHCSQT